MGYFRGHEHIPSQLTNRNRILVLFLHRVNRFTIFILTKIY